MASKVEYKTVLIGLVIGLLVGAGAGYVFGQSSLARYKDEIDMLEAENLDLKGQREQLLEEYTTLQDQLEDIKESLTQSTRAYTDLLQEQEQLTLSCDELQEEYTSLSKQLKLLEDENEYLNLSYEGLIETMELFRVSNFSRRTELNLSAGPTKTYRYDIGYGIIWEVVVEFTGRTVGFGMSWIRGENRGSVGGMGCSLTERPSTVNILIQLDIYDTGGDYIEVSCDAECLEFPWISKSSGGRFTKIPPT